MGPTRAEKSAAASRKARTCTQLTARQPEPSKACSSTRAPTRVTPAAPAIGVTYQAKRGAPEGITLIPFSYTSPGHPTFFNDEFIAGADLGEADADRSLAVISASLAAALFPNVEPSDAIGEYLDPAQAVVLVKGVYSGQGDVLIAASTPPQRFGFADISGVAFRSSASERLVLTNVRDWLVGRENLSAAEVFYREMLRPDAVVRNSNYEFEIAMLFELLALCALVLAVMNLINQALLSGAERQRFLAIYPHCAQVVSLAGASRRAAGYAARMAARDRRARTPLERRSVGHGRRFRERGPQFHLG